jgi:hypothetical protein
MGRWDARLKIIAKLIPPGSSVLDVGAGDCALDRFIKSGSYTPVDKIPQRGSWEWDIETPWPYPRKSWDIAILSGVLEYVKSPYEAMLEVAKLAPRAIVSYDHAGSFAYREGLGFKSHLSRAGIEREFARAAWRYKVVATYKHQVIYELQR